MKNSDFIRIIDEAFDRMLERNEESVIVYYFDNVQQIVLPSGGILQCDFIKIIMRYVAKEVRVIKVLYRNKNIHEILFFGPILEEKIETIKYLRRNNIMPTPEKWKEARSLSNISSSAEIIGGCNYEKAITEQYS